MERLANVHPGEILEKDFLIPMDITAYALAKAIGVDQTRISQLIKKVKEVSAQIHHCGFLSTSICLLNSG